MTTSMWEASSGQHGAALRWALSKVGQHEIPTGSNTGPFVVECQRATWLVGTNWPWCVAFFQAAWRYGASRALPWLGAGAYAFLTWAQSAGWAVAIEHAVPGDAIVWNVGAGHCSMLVKPYAETKPYVVTVDGNVGDSVRVCKRSVGLVRGAIHLPEQAPATKQPKPKPDAFEVVTSHSGHSQVVYASGSKAIARKLPAILRRHRTITIRPRRKAA
jgi:hypothetical protein